MIEKSKYWYNTIEKSFLIDLLTLNNAIYRDLLTLNKDNIKTQFYIKIIKIKLFDWHAIIFSAIGWMDIPYREYIKTAKIGGFCEEMLCENSSEAVQKIARVRRDYHKCSSCVIVCWIAKIYQSITDKKDWLLRHLWCS